MGDIVSNPRLLEARRIATRNSLLAYLATVMFVFVVPVGLMALIAPIGVVVAMAVMAMIALLGFCTYLVAAIFAVRL